MWARQLNWNITWLKKMCDDSYHSLFMEIALDTLIDQKSQHTMDFTTEWKFGSESYSTSF